MEVVNYIDWRGIYETVKKNQLKYYPTAESYIEDLRDNNEPFEYVEEMYRLLKEDFSQMDVFNSENYDDDSFIDIMKKRQIFVEFSEGGNNATENGDNYWGYGFCFKIDLDEDFFIGYHYENYS